jgi:hypothetical protein
MPNKFEKLAQEAAEKADEHFANEFSRLTRLSDSDIDAIINESGISKKDLAEVLNEVKASTASNEAKATAIKKINNGVSVLVSIVKRLI